MSSFKDAIARLGHTEEGELLDERREDVRNTYDSLVNERNADGGLKYENLRQYTSPVKPMERPLVGREKEMEQVLAAMMRPELCNVILLADAGTGKAHANGTMVPVCDERGYVKIEDLKPGDKVFDENGKPIDVLQIFPQGKKRAFRVTFDDGSTNICNDEHIWHVQSRYSHYMRYNDYQNLTLREILDKGLKKTCVRKDTGRVYETSKWFAPVNHAVERPEYDFPVHPYVVGVLLGDGSLSSPTSGRLIVSTNDEFVVKKVATLIGSEEVVQSKSTYDWYFKRPDVKFYNNKPVYYLMQNEILSDVCFVDTMAHVKSVSRRIPEIYFLGSIEQRRELLQGLMDTDGCVTGDYKLLCKFSTHSEGLAKDVQRLAASLGYRTSFKSFERCKYGVQQISYEIYFRIPLNERENLFTLPRQLEKIASCKDAYNRKYHRIYEDIAIVDVEDLGYSVDMTCIYVNNPNHLYQVGYEHLVTHNTALVQGLMKQDIERLYLEVDLSKMIADVSDNTQLGDKLKQLFAEVQNFHEANDLEIVLFMDEFHQIVQLSHAAVEALKPLLADSGTRGIRVIAATTFIEFRDFVQPNQPLVERLQRINLDAPDKKTVVQILKGMAKRYGVDNQFPSDAMFEMIYEMTNRYIPANSQPCKSILILDTMVGWYRYKKRKMNMRLLADVIYETEGVNIAFRVDATKIKEELDKYVFAQQFATSVIEERLQVCVADLNNKNKPMASMLFSGPTGVGKTEISKQLARILFDDEHRLIRFDMTEYANPDSLDSFRNELTNKVWARPFSIILLDEIEKACAPVTRLLLQVLDDGRLMDENNREVVFTNAYIIMTTNAGSEVYRDIAQYDASDTGDGQHLYKYEKLIRKSISGTTGDNRFPPELLGRIDCIVPFQPLSEKTQMNIVASKLEKLIDDVRKKHGVELQIKAEVVEYICRDRISTDSDAGGARAAISKMESEVFTAVARHINAHPDDIALLVDVAGQIAWKDKYVLDSEAYIVVKPIKQNVVQYY